MAEDKYVTNITLPIDLIEPLDELMPYAMSRGLIGRSAHRNDLIRLFLKAGIQQLQQERLKDEREGRIAKPPSRKRGR